MTVQTMTNLSFVPSAPLPPAGLFRQRGVSLMGAVFVIIVLVVFALIGMKIVPSYSEYKAIDKAVLKARGAASEAEARKLFATTASMEDISAITPADLQIVKDGGDIIISYAYASKLKLVGPVSLVIDYAGTTKNR